MLQVGVSGEDGLQDGSFDMALFNHPQASTIYVFAILFF